MRKVIFSIVIILLSLNFLYADSDGYFNTSKGILVYEQWLSDPDHIYIVTFGTNSRINDPIAFKLPTSITQNVWSIDFDENILKVILVDGEFVFIEINLAEDKEPEIIKTYRTDFKDYTLGTSFRGNLGLWSHSKVFELESEDEEHSYELITEKQEIDGKKPGVVFWKHSSWVAQKDINGGIIQKLQLFEDIFEEYID
jgi:hypothetical protein